MHPFYTSDPSRSISAPTYCKRRIRASSVTSSTSSWSFMSTNQQVISESSQSNNSEDQMCTTALNNRAAINDTRLPSIAHMNNLHDRHQKPNKTNKGGAGTWLLIMISFSNLLCSLIAFSWRSLFPFGRASKKPNPQAIEKQSIANPTNFRSADFKLHVMSLTISKLIIVGK